MDADQKAICLFLKGFPNQWVSARIIARQACGRRRYLRDADWAVPILSRMVEKGLLEVDSQDHFKLKKSSGDRKKQTWVSPQIRSILERSSKDFSQVYEITDEELEELENWGL